MKYLKAIWIFCAFLFVPQRRPKEVMENEARSCSMDYGCITPLYVYRMWGGQFSMEEIENGLREIWKGGFVG